MPWRKFKGGDINKKPGKPVYTTVACDSALGDAENVLVPESALASMAANEGDIAYVCDRRWWFGGLRSAHIRIGGISPDEKVYVGTAVMKSAHFSDQDAVYIEKVC